MAIEIARETTLDLGPELRLHFEYVVPLPKPYVRLFGAAANAAGRSLVNLIELSASNCHYKAVVELPQVQFCDNEVEWTVDHNSEVTIEGQISSAAIFADKPLTGNKRNRVQLCPTEPWAISFNLPGPVDWWTTSVFFTSRNIMVILVMKSNPEAKSSASGLTTRVPVAGTSTAGSTALVPGVDFGSRPVGSTLLNTV
ncbi:hypothetical protein R6Q59_037018 [Mikania micrantha]